MSDNTRKRIEIASLQLNSLQLNANQYTKTGQNGTGFLLQSTGFFMRFLIITVCLSQFCGAFMGSALNVLVPYLAADYAVQPQDISWLINVFTMCAAAFLLPASALASFLGNQRLYRTGCILAVASTVLIPFCPNFTLLMAGRALQGMAFSLLFCTAMAVLSANIDREHRATAIGLATGAVYAGLSCGPFLSGYLVELFGWPSVFFLAAGGQFIAFLLAGRIRKDPRRSRSLHWRKMLMCFAGFLLVLLSGSLLHQTAEAIVCALAGLVLLVLYFRAEERSHEPLCRLSFIAGNKSLSLRFYKK